MQALAACFTHSTARKRMATQTEESSATVTPLADAHLFHTAAVVHSAPRVRYLQLMAGATLVLGRAPAAHSHDVERHSPLPEVGACRLVRRRYTRRSSLRFVFLRLFAYLINFQLLLSCSRSLRILQIPSTTPSLTITRYGTFVRLPASL
jgi:hypothetical protein